MPFPSMYSDVQKFGRLPDIDAGDSNQDVWDGEDAYPYPSAAITMTVSSSSADDTAAGTGARTIRLFGLNNAWEEVAIDLTLDGQTGVTIGTDLIRVYRAYLLTAGANEVNAGNIWIGSGSITNGVPAVKYAGILAGMGQTLMAIYTIPARIAAGHIVSEGLVERWYGTVSAAKDAYASIALQTKEFGGAWRTRRVAGLGEGGFMDERLGHGIEVPVKTEVRVRVLTNGVINSSIEAGFDIALR